MHIALISGSTRARSQSRRIADHLVSRLGALAPAATTDIIDLATLKLPMWDEAMWEKGSDAQVRWAPVAERLRACQGFVMISPEWGGMVPPAVKNFLLHCGADDLGHKPGLITAVSAGRGGAYPVAELRMSGYKNTHVLWLPDHVIVREVEKLDTAADPATEPTLSRIDYGLKLLLAYADALIPVRASGVIDHARFRNGM